MQFLRAKGGDLPTATPQVSFTLSKNLRDRCWVGECFDDLPDASIHVRAVEEPRSRFLLHDDHLDRAAKCGMRGRERFDTYDNVFPVNGAVHIRLKFAVKQKVKSDRCH